MMRDAQRWMVAQIAGLCLAAAATVASAADLQVTDADRTYRNFTRESATVRPGEIRVEVRGLMVQDEGNTPDSDCSKAQPPPAICLGRNTRLDLLGFPVKRLPAAPQGADSLTGGILELVGSYGLTKNVEVGFIVPGFIQSLKLRQINNVDGAKINDADVGDLLLYGKFQRALAEHWAAGGGVELTTPNGPKDKGFGTGELGLNPFFSTRYQQGRFGVGANVGWNFYSGGVPDVLNYGAEVILRASSSFALRTEIAGRVFDQNGTRFHDLTLLPGVDFNLSDNVTIRPTGLIGGTNTASDWGIGLGMAVSF